MAEHIVILQRFSVVFQLAVVVLLAVFFAVLARSVRLQEVRLWAMTWIADALALTAVLIFTFLSPDTLYQRLALIGFLIGKTGFVILLVSGARHHLRPGLEPQLKPRPLALFLVAWGSVVGFSAPGFLHAHIAQSLLVGVVLTTGGITVLRHPRSPISRWLGWAMVTEGLLFLHTMVLIFPLLWGGRIVFEYVQLQSFVDGIAELFVALSCLVAVADREAQQMRAATQELEESHRRLSRLVDLDPLTGLANRRLLRKALDQARQTGAAIIFMDINDFKEVNDRFGHQIGDLALKRTAKVLTDSFRPQDRVFRWGGDEFLVIAPNLSAPAAQSRISRVRELLSSPDMDAPRCSISVGICVLEAGGDPTAALDKADQMMYQQKRHRLPTGEHKAI